MAAEGLFAGRAGISQQAVFEQFFAQGVAVDAQPLRRFALVLVGAFHYQFQQGRFNHAQQHIVHIAGGLALQVFNIVLQIGADIGLQFGVRHGDRAL